MEERKYAGFWIRVAAAIVDSIIFIAVFGALIYGIFGMGAIDPTLIDGGIEEGAMSYLFIFIYNILPIIVTIWFWIAYKGTPGKMILGLEIVHKETGETISIGASILRYIGYIISMIPLGLGYLWVAFDSKKRGWHDFIGGTVVVYKEED